MAKRNPITIDSGDDSEFEEEFFWKKSLLETIGSDSEEGDDDFTRQVTTSSEDEESLYSILVRDVLFGEEDVKICDQKREKQKEKTQAD